MKPLHIFVISFALVLFGAAPIVADAPWHSAVNPESRGSDWWQSRANQLNEKVKETPDTKLVFIGDSITQGWEGAGAKVWEKHYTPRNAVNLGIGGDRTQHVMWRIDNGNLEGIQPKAAVVMIGTNNSNGTDNTAEQIVDGVTAIVARLRSKVPDTKVLLLGIFPRGENINPQRGKILQINQVLAKLDDGKHVHYLDIGHNFVNRQGLIPQDVMPDFLHLSEKGYQIWADAIEQKLEEFLGDGDAAANGSPISGKWTFTIRGPNDEDVEIPLEMTVDGTTLTGRIGRREDGWLKLDGGKVEDKRFSFSVTRDRPEGGTMVYQLQGIFADSKLSGSVTAGIDGEEVTRDWRASRAD